VKEQIKYLHWGTGWERAEVGLLTRHIVVQGDEGSVNGSFGGHLMMRRATLHLSGVEFTRLGKVYNRLLPINRSKGSPWKVSSTFSYDDGCDWTWQLCY
jgi:hypothetical protein